MQPKVSIILLNYNGLKFNKDCIDSLLIQSYTDFEIIFVDNVSTDWSTEIVEQLFQDEITNWKIKIIRNSVNNWFSWWNNTWVDYSNATDYIWLLNNDTVADKDALKYLIKWIESDEKLWAVWSLVLDKWYEEQIKQQLFLNKNKFSISIFWETILEKVTENEIITWIYKSNALSWCSLLYKKHIISKPFEDYYFAYAEDVYLSLLLIIRWYTLWVCSKSIVLHFWSWSFWKKPSELKLFHWNKNQIINFLIFYNTYHRILLYPIFLFKEACHLFMGYPTRRLKAKLKWIIWIYNNYDSIKKTRKKVILANKEYSRFLCITLTYRATDIFYLNSWGFIKIILVNFINLIFNLYWKIIKKVI